MNNFILSSRFFVVSRFKLSSSISRFTSRSLFDPSKKTQTLDQNFSEGRKEEGKSRNRGGGYLNRSVQRQLFSPFPSKVGRDLDARSRKRGRRNRGVNRGVYQRLFLHAFTRRFRNTTRRSSPVSSRYLMNFVPRIEEIAFSIARHVHSGDRWKAFNDRPVSLPRKEVAILDPALLVSGRWWSCSPTNDSP